MTTPSKRKAKWGSATCLIAILHPTTIENYYRISFQSIVVLIAVLKANSANIGRKKA